MNPWLEAFAWACLHSLWQTAGLLLIVNSFAQHHKHNPRLQDGLVKASILITIAGFFTTFFFYFQTTPLSSSTGFFNPELLQHGPAGTATAPNLLDKAAGLQTVWEMVFALTSDGIGLLFWVWLPGFLWTFAHQARGLYRLTHLEALPVAKSLRRPFGKTMARLGCTSKIQLALVPGLPSPCTVGTVRPKIWLPESWAETVPKPWLPMVFTHELCHIRRQDYLVQLLALPFNALFWWQPFYRKLIRHLQESREYCCDEAVLDQGFDPLAYADLLLALGRQRMKTTGPQMGMAGRPLLARVKRFLEPAAPPTGTFGSLCQRVFALGFLAVMGYGIFGIGVQPTPNAQRRTFLKTQIQRHLGARDWQGFAEFFIHAHRHRKQFRPTPQRQAGKLHHPR